MHYTIGYYKSITYIPPREALSFSSRCCILPACYQHHVQQQGPKIKKAFGRRSCDIIGPPSRYIKIIKEKNKIAEAVRKLNYIYIYIVLNTHTYTRMCIYIYLSLRVYGCPQLSRFQNQLHLLHPFTRHLWRAMCFRC